MWTMSARKPEGFKVEVFGVDNELVHSKWYPEQAEAQRAGEQWQRLVLDFDLKGSEAPPPLDDIMSDDALLSELGLGEGDQ